MAFFKSPFEKLSGTQLQGIADSTAYTAAALSTDGAIFGILVDMNNHLAQIAKNTDPKNNKVEITGKGAKMLGTAMPGIGQGVKLIAEAINSIPDGEEAKKKMAAITGGIDVLSTLGMAIFKFAGMLALSLPLLILGIPALMLAVPMVLAVGGLFYLLGKMGIDKEIKQVAAGLAIAGLAMVVLAGGIVLTEMILSYAGNPLATFATVSMIVLGTALVFGIAGMFAGTILKGAAVMTLATVPIILLGLSMALFASAVPPTSEGWETIGQVMATLTGIGLVMAAAGFVAVAIIPGAAAMVVAGLALISVAVGLAAISAIFKPGKMDYLLADSGQVTEGFLGFGAGRPMSNLEWAMLSIARSFILPAAAIAGMYVGAPAILMAGVALISIAKGLEKFQALDIDYDILPGQIAKVTGVLATAFGEVGKKYPGGGGGFLSAIMGSGSDTSEVAQGISAVSGMGKALTGIATGVQAMADLRFPTKWDKNGNPIEFRQLTDDDFTRVTINTQRIVSALSSTFGKIGANPDAKDTWGWFGNSNMEEGIEIVEKMSNPLSKLAAFVQEFGRKKLDVAGVTKNTQLMIKSMTSAFMQGGTKLTADDAGKYADAYADMADSAEDMAEYMGDWKDNVNDLDLEKVVEVRKLYEGLAALSSANGTSMLETMNENMVDAINLLAEKLSEFAGEVKSSSGPSILDQGKSLLGIGGGTEKPSAPTAKPATTTATPMTNTGNSSELTAAIKNLERVMMGTLNVNVVNNNLI